MTAGGSREILWKDNMNCSVWKSHEIWTNTQVRIAEAGNTTQYWPNLGRQQSVIVIGPVSLFASVKCWADDGGFCKLFKFTDLQSKLGPASALYQADYHFYYGKPFWKWRNQISAQHWPVAVPKTSVGGQSLG